MEEIATNPEFHLSSDFWIETIALSITAALGLFGVFTDFSAPRWKNHRLWRTVPYITGALIVASLFVGLTAKAREDLSGQIAAREAKNASARILENSEKTLQNLEAVEAKSAELNSELEDRLKEIGAQSESVLVQSKEIATSQSSILTSQGQMKKTIGEIDESLIALNDTFSVASSQLDESLEQAREQIDSVSAELDEVADGLTAAQVGILSVVTDLQALPYDPKYSTVSMWAEVRSDSPFYKILRNSSEFSEELFSLLEKSPSDPISKAKFLGIMAKKDKSFRKAYFREGNYWQFDLEPTVFDHWNMNVGFAIIERDHLWSFDFTFGPSPPLLWFNLDSPPSTLHLGYDETNGRVLVHFEWTEPGVLTGRDIRVGNDQDYVCAAMILAGPSQNQDLCAIDVEVRHSRLLGEQSFGLVARYRGIDYGGNLAVTADGKLPLEIPAHLINSVEIRPGVQILK